MRSIHLQHSLHDHQQARREGVRGHLGPRKADERQQLDGINNVASTPDRALVSSWMRCHRQNSDHCGWFQITCFSRIFCGIILFIRNRDGINRNNNNGIYNSVIWTESAFLISGIIALVFSRVQCLPVPPMLLQSNLLRKASQLLSVKRLKTR